jgi:hypothetical protein
MSNRYGSRKLPKALGVRTYSLRNVTNKIMKNSKRSSTRCGRVGSYPTMFSNGLSIVSVTLRAQPGYLPRAKKSMAATNQHFNRLHGETMRYTCVDNFDRNRRDHPELSEMTKHCRYDHTLMCNGQYPYPSMSEYRVDMPVLLCYTIDNRKGLVNDLRRKIIGFGKHNEAQLPSNYAYPNDPNVDCETLPSDITAAALPHYGRTLSNTRLNQIKDFLDKHRNLFPIVKFSNGIIRTVLPDCYITEYGYKQP